MTEQKTNTPVVETEKKEKTRFYGTGKAKDFARLDYLAIVDKVLRGEGITNMESELAIEATAHEIKKLENAAAKRVSGDPKDPLESEYAVALEKAIIPFLSSTPQTALELQKKMTAAGKLSPKGKDFAVTWIARVLNSEKVKAIHKVVISKKIVEKVNKDGLRNDSQCTAYNI